MDMAVHHTRSSCIKHLRQNRSIVGGIDRITPEGSNERVS